MPKRRMARGVRPLSETHPDQVHRLKDPSVADQISASSNKKVSWVCEVDREHQWESSCYSVLIRGTGCSICSNKRIQKGKNDLKTTHPQVARFLVDPIIGTRVTAGSNDRSIEWNCANSSSHAAYCASPNDRTRAKGSCPTCTGHRIEQGINDLATTHPTLAAQLVHPEQSLSVTAGNGRARLEWKCSADQGHPNWHASVANRALQNTGCPICGGTKVSPGFNDLATLNPELAKELVQPELASTLAPYSMARVEWRCCADEEHENWYSSPSNRTSGRGCPACATSGFNPDRVALFYVVHGRLPGERRSVVQYGITNSPQTRLPRHTRNGFSRRAILLLHGLGADVRDFETSLKRSLVEQGVRSCRSYGYTFDGATESMFVDDLSAEQLVGVALLHFRTASNLRIIGYREESVG